MKERIIELEKQLKERDEKIAILEQKIDELMRLLYAATSEKLSPSELEGEELGKPEASSASDAAPEEDESKDKTRKRKKGGKKKYPRKLKIVIAAVIIPDEVKANPELWEEIDEDHQDLWDFIPAQYLIRRTVNKIYRHKHDKSQPPVQATMPAAPIVGTRCTPDFAAHLLVSKYCDHLPQYRTEHILKERYGIAMPRQKLNRWNRAIAQRLRPIWEAIKREMLASQYLQIDETPSDTSSQDMGKQNKDTYGFTTSLTELYTTTGPPGGGTRTYCASSAPKTNNTSAASSNATATAPTKPWRCITEKASP